MRLARLGVSQCRQELAKNRVPHRLEQKRKHDIRTPLRLSGPVAGVSFHAPKAPIPFGKLDCRLAVALHEMSQWLARYDVVGVRVDNMYRPGAVIAGKKKPSQHAAGLAIDVMAFTLRDGSELVIERDWQGALGKVYCGPGAVLRAPKTPAAIKLRNMVCSVVRAGLFHHTVTPSDNRAHADHLHFDLDPKAKRVRVEL